MREAWALVRSSWLTAASYRIGMIMSLIGLAAVLLPLYFIANALQPTMQQTIAAEAHQYFGFVVLGAISFSLITSCSTSLASALDGAIGRGTFEVILGTRARLSAICLGLMGYGVLWALLRGAILFGVAVLLGLSVVWKAVPLGAVLLALTMLSYVGIGLVFAALVLAFRTYGLRALRQVVLRGDPLSAVARDVGILAAITVVTMCLGVTAFYFALRYARRAGTLSTY